MLNEYLDGKAVALVGGAENYEESQLEPYDIVVRIKNHWLRTKGRIDAMYWTGEGHGDDALRMLDEVPRVQFVIFGVPDKYIKSNALGPSPLDGWLEETKTPCYFHWCRPRYDDGKFWTGTYSLYSKVLEETLGPYRLVLSGTSCAYLVRRFSKPKMLHLYGYEQHQRNITEHGHNYRVDDFILSGFEFRGV